MIPVGPMNLHVLTENVYRSDGFATETMIVATIQMRNHALPPHVTHLKNFSVLKITVSQINGNVTEKKIVLMDQMKR